MPSKTLLPVFQHCSSHFYRTLTDHVRMNLNIVIEVHVYSQKDAISAILTAPSLAHAVNTSVQRLQLSALFYACKHHQISPKNDINHL
jgi:hypothetical protein